MNEDFSRNYTLIASATSLLFQKNDCQVMRTKLFIARF